MKQNVNNDVTKDSPVASQNWYDYHYENTISKYTLFLQERLSFGLRLNLPKCLKDFSLKFSHNVL